jgi:aerobic carbon-monoxide dehydrogenase medium subunit
MTYLRRLPRFEYLAPRTIGEVCGLLAGHADETRLLGGGTDLVLQMRRREIAPRYIIGLKGVSELACVREEVGGSVVIGAMTTIEAIMSSSVIQKRYGILSETAAEIGSPEIRQVATIGGNLAGALPCADFPPALMVLGAKLKLQSQQGERTVPLEDFFLRFERTAARRDELLTEIQLTAPPPFSGGVYLNFHDRHSMDMTTTGVGAYVTTDTERRSFRDIKIALGSSAPVPLRAKITEAALRGRDFSDEVLQEAASLVCAEAEPRDSWRAGKAFRLELIKTLTKRAIEGAWKKALASSNGRNA